ncbi:unnamed protein product [Cuscuta epithymum]|uniref:MRN complex-interacting protein N-terminal domain-containing protein n=1 Tax=Cuscuta epithymum TaxID=186058 RepID=A0AAV0DBC6_9ASTE|nr:unnamed protein product [Cuscuta epithymum]CAH9147260.1 unnamed protein product [Cuscuta epithymum]
MQTVFIALQCCQCCTMQVKQKKKSSNKWICVVCNQKQSLRKVFAQGFMAKDIRKFVQSFNMSRQLSDLPQHQEPRTLDTEAPFPSNPNSKRTDWTEYLDLEDESTEEENETRIVTELPKAMFKRPKFSNYTAGSQSDSEKRFRPVFSKRNAKKHSTLQDEDVGPMSKSALEWEDGTLESQDTPSCCSTKKVAKSNMYFVNEEPNKESLATAAKGAISKWSEYLTIDDD